MIDWALVWGVIGPAVAGLLTWLKTRKPSQARVDAAVAAAKADSAVSDAESTLYNRLRERLDALETDVTRLRSELDAERKHGRNLEIKVWRLERFIREMGKEPPKFDDDMKVGGTD